ncbi:hypothetical protein CRM22_007818 [Opisthorchis felineus]|uniref:ENTH domain-containing protein n=1 Tax=Opisthorchis felineus TaxID=147828 RepID=A0A4S2LES8_OPIFE|nr:hypothetical protein CRM22_007818 [Opisthorchis felineus]
MAGKVVKQLAGSGTGQSLSDIMTAMKHTLSGSLIAKIICKATTEEMISPKRKHLAYLVQCTFEPRLSIPDFANYLIGRTQHSNLVVVFKAFITIHHLMQYGHERFSQFIASNNCHFYLPSLSDRNTFQAHGIAAFVRPYAKYLDEKASSYREVAFDLCRMKLGKEDGGIRTMPQAKLLKTLPVIENQLDALLAFDATSNELVNSVLRVAHLHLYRDLIRLYAVYNEAMINLIGRYFTMTKRDCRTALVIYKAFLKRMEAMNAFVKIAEATDSSSFAPPHENDSITFQPVPPSVLEALEQHLSYLENHKPPESSSTRTTGTSDGTFTNSKLGATAGDFGGSQDNDGTGSTWSPGHAGSSDFVLTEKERMHIIEEERARLESFVSNARKQAQSNAETEMRTSVDLLTKLSTDAEFVDLLTSHDSDSDLAFPDTANASWPIAPTQSGHDAWSLPAESAATQQKQTTSGELALLDLTGPDISDPFGSVSKPNVFIPPATVITPFSAPPPASMVSSNPFLLSPASGPFTSTVPSSLHPAVNAWSTIQSQYTPFGLPTNSSETTGTTQNDAPSVPSSNGPTSSALDARLAQLAGNLTVTGDSPAASYRAPDGSVTAVKWTGTSQILRPSSNLVQTSSMRNSASLNQLTGPAVSPASGPTNPWYSPAPNMNQVYPKVPVPTTAYASMYQHWPQPHPNAAQSNPFSAVSSNTTVHSTNPFL